MLERQQVLNTFDTLNKTPLNAQASYVPKLTMLPRPNNQKKRFYRVPCAFTTVKFMLQARYQRLLRFLSSLEAR
jgi:hypothetical protein